MCKGRGDFASKFTSDIELRVEEMKSRTRERVHSRIEKNREYLSKTNNRPEPWLF